MAYNDLQDNDPKLTSFGLCRSNDHLVGGGYRWSGPRPESKHDGTKATVIVAHIRYGGDVDIPMVYCRKHAAVSRGAITKGTYSGKNTILVDNGDLSSRAAVDAEVAFALKERNDHAANVAAARAAYIEQTRPQHQLDRLNETASPWFRVSVDVDSAYGTGTVVVGYKTLTPGRARRLAKDLLKAADRVERIGVK